MKPKKLTDAEERELAAQIALRQSLSDKKLCARYGIARRTLWDIVRRQNAPRETRDPKQERSGYIYVVSWRGLVKVGISAFPQTRWEQLKEQCPGLEPFAFVSARVPNPKLIEKHIHAALVKYHDPSARPTREWFKCGRHFAIETVKCAIDCLVIAEASGDSAQFAS